MSIEHVDPQVTDAALLAIKQDVVKLCKKVFAYVLHIWSVDEKLLLKSDVSVEEVLIQRKDFSDALLEKEYVVIKMIEESLVTFGFQAKKEDIKSSEIQRFDDIYSAISSVVASAKYMKDILHNVR